MQISNEFTVDAEPQVVYETLLDFERVGPCIPGVTVGPAGPEGAYPAEIAVRLGPMKLTYKGTVRLNQRDQAARRATMVADLREARGQGAARAQLSMTVSADPESGSRIASIADVELSGRAAQMGAGIVDDVAQRLVADMAANLQKLLRTSSPSAPGAPGDVATGPPAPASRPIRGFRLLLRALWHRLRRRRRESISYDSGH